MKNGEEPQKNRMSEGTIIMYMGNLVSSLSSPIQADMWWLELSYVQTVTKIFEIRKTCHVIKVVR